VRTFARAFAITLGITLGLLTAGAIAFAGYSIYRADQDRRAEEQARASATVVAQERATAVAAQAQATATARQQEEGRRQAAAVAEEERRQAATSATATVAAIKQAARRCEEPHKLAVRIAAKWDRPVPTGVRYDAEGTVRNACNYDIEVRLELVGLALNGSTVKASKIVAINQEGWEVYGNPQAATRIRPGEERFFSVLMAQRPQADIGYIHATPIIVREGDPP
jgi:hypothetical protein